MSDLSNNQGRAYEYICLLTLAEEINKIRKAEIEKNSAYQAAEHAWSLMPDGFKSILSSSASAAVSTIFDMEPMIIENGDDILTLKIQTDNEGKDGDVRDIVLARQDVQWEIGLSLKHNHFAVKHSRLAKGLDFGKKWFGIPCSEQYWKDIKPIFDYLATQKSNKKNWSDLPTKDTAVYVPLLQAFMYELNRSNALDSSVPKKMVEYFDEHGQLVKEEYDAEDPKVRHERKKGKWEEGYFQNGIYAPKCSCCGENQYAAVTIDIKGNVHKMAYCPNCGADMRGEENETD